MLQMHESYAWLTIKVVFLLLFFDGNREGFNENACAYLDDIERNLH